MQQLPIRIRKNLLELTVDKNHLSSKRSSPGRQPRARLHGPVFSIPHANYLALIANYYPR